MELEQIDWAHIEAAQGRTIPPDERIAGEVAALRWQTDQAVNKGDWVERMDAVTRGQIQEAYDAGQTYDEWLTFQQGDADGYE